MRRADFFPRACGPAAHRGSIDMSTPNQPTDPRSAYPRPPFPAQEQHSTGKESGIRPAPDYGVDTYEGHGRLQNRVAIITGGDSGIGRAVALAYAREGADVAIVYLEQDDDAELSLAAVKQAGRRALKVRADLSRDEECKRVVDEVIAKLGRIDVLVNNAAHQGKSVERFEELTRARVEQTFQTNILAMFSLVHYALPHLKPGAVIINTASIQAYKPSANILDYATTKGAI